MSNVKRLTITKVWEIRSGQGSKGPWTLYGYDATNEQGQDIPEQLKSFSKLPIGPVDVEVERQEHEQYGVSYLLKPKKSGGEAPAELLAALRSRIERLESQVAQLTSGSPPAAAAAAPGLPDDEDIPF